MLKRKRITVSEVKRVLTAYDRIPIRFVDVELPDAMEIAGKQGLYACDA